MKLFTMRIGQKKCSKANWKYGHEAAGGFMINVPTAWLEYRASPQQICLSASVGYHSSVLSTLSLLCTDIGANRIITPSE
jgi:hypothetical protein